MQADVSTHLTIVSAGENERELLPVLMSLIVILPTIYQTDYRKVFNDFTFGAQVKRLKHESCPGRRKQR